MWNFYPFIVIMKYFKQIWISLLSVFGLLIINFWYWDVPSLWPKIDKFNWDSAPVIDSQEITDINEWSKTFSDKLWWILHLPQKNEYTTSLWYITSLIQISINWLLWILAFVALVYMLYCWFLVFSSWSEEKNASKGKKWISTAAIALAWIGLSWLIVSVIIRFINNIVPQN